jgi:hypothetical protein
MKSRIAVVSFFCILSAVVGLAQTSTNTTSATPNSSASTPAISGQGAARFLPVWTSSSTLGDSILFQAGGSVGVRTTSPQATFDVESTGVFGILGATSSTAPFAAGVTGRSASTTGNAVVGEATATSGINNGVFGQSASPTGVGVSGSATAAAGGIGVYGQTVSTLGVGVAGASLASTGNAPGVYGQTASTEFGAGVNGTATATTGNAVGVFGSAAGTNGNGVFGYASSASGSTIGVSGFVESPTGTAGRFVAHAGLGLILQGNSGSNQTQVFSVDASGNGFFAGNLNITGNVSKGSGSFKIDHPRDPANKYLSHSFVESPDMMNVYNGIVVLDARGSAWVDLPDYFQDLNRDYRYQLTSIGAPGPRLFIATEVSANRFQIAGGKPHAKVSWQVTGIRHDAFANAHRIQVEEEKPSNQRGTYLHPELFGEPAAQTIGWSAPTTGALPTH